VTQSGYDPNQNYLTDVGAFTGSGSFYGTFDQNGNVFQWNDKDGSPGPARGIRGGGWSSQEADLERRFPSTINAVAELDNVGFRLASPVAVPEPSTYAMALAGLACGGYTMFRRRKRA
jgi:formylglycine-generating enzyme required for sulfatase activity